MEIFICSFLWPARLNEPWEAQRFFCENALGSTYTRVLIRRMNQIFLKHPNPIFILN